MFLLDLSLCAMGGLLGVTGYAMYTLMQRTTPTELVFTSSEGEDTTFDDTTFDDNSTFDSLTLSSTSTHEVTPTPDNTPEELEAKSKVIKSADALLTDPGTYDLLDRVSSFAFTAESLLLKRHAENPAVTDFLTQAFERINSMLEDIDPEISLDTTPKPWLTK